MPYDRNQFAAQMLKMRGDIEIEAEKRARSTYEELLIPAFDKFYGLPPYQRQGLALNKPTLYIAAVSFWEDLLRLKTYQPVDVPDNHKQAAHIFKWISRLRPIKPVVDYVPKLEVHLLQANAWYAMACAQAYLKILKIEDAEEGFIVYSSTYRDIHAREWSMIFYLLETLNSKK